MNDNIIQLDKNSFILTSNNDRVSAFGNAKPGNIGTNFNPTGVYNNNYIGYDLNGIRNANQSNWNRFGYVAANFVPNFLVAIGEGLGSLGYPIFGFNSDYGRAMDGLSKLRNPFTSDDFMLNYKDPSKAYDLSDPSFYFSAGSGLAESIASFAVTGNIFAGGIEALEPFVAKAVTNTVKAAKYVNTFGKTAELAPNTSRNILNAMRYAKQGTQALAMSNSEGTMIGHDVYNQGLMHYSKPIIAKIYNQKLQNYINQTNKMNPDVSYDITQIPPAIKQMLMDEAIVEGKTETNKIYGKELGKAAFVTSVTNALIGSVLEWTAAGLFINKNPNLNKAVLRGANGERTGVSNALHGVKDATEGASKLATMTPILNKANAFGMYMSQGGQEFLEEAWMNNTAEWLGTKYLGINDKDYNDFIFSTKSLIDGTLGFIGGFGQTALTNIGTKYIDGKRIGKDGTDLGYMSRNTYNDYLYNNSVTTQLENAKKDLIEFGQAQLSLNKLYEEKNNLSPDNTLEHRRLKLLIDAAEDELFNLSKRRTIRDGNGDMLLSFYQNILELDNTKSTKDEQNNDTGKSEAMLAGFATKIGDDNYKKRAAEAINSIKEAQQIYEDAQLQYNVDGHDHTGYGESILNYHILTNDVKHSVNKFTEEYNKREQELNTVVQNMNMGNISNYIETIKTNRAQKAELKSLEDVLKLHKKELAEYNKKVDNSKETDDDYLYLQGEKDVFRSTATQKITNTENRIAEAKKKLSNYANVKKQAFNDYLLQDETYFEQQQKIDKHNLDIQNSKDTIELEKKNKGKFINDVEGKPILDTEANDLADKNIKIENAKIKEAKAAIDIAKGEQLKIAIEKNNILKQNIDTLNLYIDSSVNAKQNVNQVSQGLAKLQQEMLDLQSHKGKQQYRENWLNHKNYINTLYSKYFNIQEDNNITNSQEDVEPVITPEEKKEVVNVEQNTTVNKVLSVIDEVASELSKENNKTIVENRIEAIEKIRNDKIIRDLNGKPIVGNLVDVIGIINSIKDNKITLTKDDINKINALLEVYNVIDGNLQKTFQVSLKELLDVLNTSDNVEFVDIARLLSNSNHEYNEYTIKINTKKFTGDKHPTLHDIIREGINAINNLSTRIDNFELSPVLLELNNTLGYIVLQHNNYTEVLNKYIELFNKQQTTTKTNNTNTEETEIEEKDIRTPQEILFDTAISDLETQLALRDGSIMKMLNSEVIKFFDNTVSPDDEIELNKITNEQLKINSLNDIVTIKKLLDKFNDKGAKNYLLAKLLLANGQVFYKTKTEVVENDKIDGSTRIYDVLAQITRNGEISDENKHILDNIKALEVGETITPKLTKNVPEHVKIIEDAGKTVADDDVTLLDSKGNIVGSIQTKQYQASALAFGKALVKIATNENSKLNDIKKALNDLLYRSKNTKNKEDSAKATTEYANIAKELEATGKLTINGITIEIDSKSLKELQKYYTKEVATNATKVLEHLVRLLNRHKNNEMSLAESLQRWVDVMNNDIKINKVLRKSAKDGKRKFKVVSKSTGSIEIGEQTKLGQHIKVTFEEAKSTNFLVTKNNTGTIINAITGITVDNSIIKHLNKGQLVILSNNTLNGKEVPISIIQKNLSEKSINHVITLFKQLVEEYKTNGRNKTKSAFGYNNISNKIEGFIQKTYKGVKVFNIDTSTGNIRINGKTTYDLNDATQVEALKKVLATLQRNINFDLLKNNKEYFNSIMDSDDIVTNIKPLMVDGKVVSLTQPNGRVPFGIKIEEDSNEVDNSTTKTDNDILSKGDDNNTKVESDAKSDTEIDNPIIEASTEVTNQVPQSPVEKEDTSSSDKSIKEGITDIFRESPELASIGTQQQYNEYLNTIFPDSKVKDIIYHGTKSKSRLEIFDENQIGALDSGYFGRGFYLTPDKQYASNYIGTEGHIESLIVNVQNPLETDMNKANTNISLNNNDSAIVTFGEDLAGLNEVYQNPNEIAEIVIKESNQIHILGSKQDIEGFKKYINSDKSIIGIDEDIDDINEIDDGDRSIKSKNFIASPIAKELFNIIFSSQLDVINNSQDVLHNFINSKYMKEQYSEELADLIDKLLSFKFNVRIVDDIDDIDKHGFDPKVKGSYMFFQGKTKTIIIGKKQILTRNHTDFIESFLHEIIHGIIIDSLKDENNPIYKIIYAEYKKYKDKLAVFDNEGNFIEKLSPYGITDIDEFVSELISNPKFRTELNESGAIKEGLNFITKLVNAITEFLFGKTYFGTTKDAKQLNTYKLISDLIDYKVGNNDIYSTINNNINSNSINKINVPLFDYTDNNEIKYSLEAVDILQSDKAKQIFEKGNKNGWDLNKILTELAIPKEQKQLLLDLGITDREQLAVELVSKYAFAVEMNVATEDEGDSEADRYNYWFETNDYFYQFDAETNKYYKWSKETNKNITPLEPEFEITKTVYYKDLDKYKNSPTQQHKNLSARDKNNNVKYEGNPDWSYKEIGINTPLIQNSSSDIHEPFKSNFNNTTIGHIRVWVNEKTGEVEIQEIQSDLFQNGRDKEDLLKRSNDNYVFRNGKLIGYEKNQFLQLLNKDNNWVTFFIKATVQNFAKQGYTTIRFPKGETAAKIEGHELISDKINKLNNQIELIKSKDSKVYNKQDDYYIVGIEGFMTSTEQQALEYIEKEKQNLKDNGIAKLAPIEYFYENTVTNILKKITPIEEVTDEFGNKWSKVTIVKNINLSEIATQQEIEEQRKHCNK